MLRTALLAFASLLWQCISPSGWLLLTIACYASTARVASAMHVADSLLLAARVASAMLAPDWLSGQAS